MKCIELTKEQFAKYLPYVSFEDAIAAQRLYDHVDTIPVAESLIQYWEKKNGNK